MLPSRLRLHRAGVAGAGEAVVVEQLAARPQVGVEVDHVLDHALEVLRRPRRETAPGALSRMDEQHVLHPSRASRRSKLWFMPVLHAGAEGGVARLCGRVDDGADDRRAVVVLVELDGVERLGPGSPQRSVLTMRSGRTTSRYSPCIARSRAVGAAPDEAPRAARAQVELAHGHRVAVRAEHPLLDVLGLRPGVEDLLGGRLDEARRHDLEVRRGACRSSSRSYRLPASSCSFCLRVLR